MKLGSKTTRERLVCMAIGCAKVIRRGIMCKRHWLKLDPTVREEVAALWMPGDQMMSYQEAKDYYMACIHAAGMLGLMEGRIDFNGLMVLEREAENRFKREHGHLKPR